MKGWFLMKFKPNLMYDSLNNGSYKGIIKEIAFNSERYCKFKIAVEEQDGLFIHLFSTEDVLFNEFTYHFVDDDGYFAPDKLIDKTINFTIKQRQYGENIVTKMTEISVV